jgi:pimeloyl-ACP methyl ester carboxylesterase
MKKKTLRILAAVAVALAIPYVAFDLERTTLTETIRKDLPGRFVKLSDGVTHYSWQGPEKDPVVVLVHGFTTPLFVWDNTAPALAAAGLRVLRYDLYGRGLSDRPVVDYTEDLFHRQLTELLAALNVNGAVRLVGFSMGAAVAAIVAARAPGRVDKLVLIAPAGFPVNLPVTGRLVRLPVLGPYLMTALGDGSLIRGVRKALYDPRNAPTFTEKFKIQLTYKGYKRAIVSTLNHFDIHNQQAAYEAAGRHPRPVLVIWGKQDTVIPFGHSRLVKRAMPRAQLLALEAAGHVCHYESPAAVNPALVGFLKP